MLTLLLTMVGARADQCAWVSQTAADAAVKYLQPGVIWASFCEPCGDKKPVFGKLAEPATVRPTEAAGMVEVVVDGKPVDLAYVYVLKSLTDPTLANLASLATCETTGVSPTVPKPAKPLSR